MTFSGFDLRSQLERKSMWKSYLFLERRFLWQNQDILSHRLSVLIGPKSELFQDILLNNFRQRQYHFQNRSKLRRKGYSGCQGWLNLAKNWQFGIFQIIKARSTKPFCLLNQRRLLGLTKHQPSSQSVATKTFPNRI